MDDPQTKHEILILAIGTILVEARSSQSPWLS